MSEDDQQDGAPIGGDGVQAALLDAVVSVAADLTLDGVLARIVATSRQLTGARYAALGVVDPDPAAGLRTFVHQGMEPVQVEQVGRLPQGHGILGLLIDHPEPLRLRDLTAHPESYGFPPGHPPMRSFLGVPVRSRGLVFGNLYLTEKQGGTDFTRHDEDVVVALAAAAGVAIENARLYEESLRREAWLSATADLGGMLSEADPNALAGPLREVADRARVAAGADVAWLVVCAPEEPDLVAAAGPDLADDDLQGLSLEGSLSATVIRAGEPISTTAVQGGTPALSGDDVPGVPSLGSAVLVPLRSGSGVGGVMGLGWEPGHVDRYRTVDPRLPAAFAEQLALALAVLRSHAAQQRLTLFEERDRIGRDLHDLVIQRLFAVGLSLESLIPVVDAAPLSHRLGQAVDDLDATIREIRRSIFGLRGDQSRSDIQTEVTLLVERAAATLKLRPTLTFAGPVRTLVGDDVAPHLLAVVAEALSNVARHSGARRVDVSVSAGEQLDLVVADTGRGVPPGAQESGLGNMRQRAAQLGGECRVESSAQGTAVTWSVPLGGRRPGAAP